MRKAPEGRNRHQGALTLIFVMASSGVMKVILSFNHKNYNFLNCDWFKKLLFPTKYNPLAKLLSDTLLSDSLLSDSLLSDSLLSDSSTNQSNSNWSLNQQITFKVVV